MDNIKLPYDTKNVLKNNINLIDNFNLKLNKLVNFENGKFLYKSKNNNIHQFNKNLIYKVSENYYKKIKRQNLKLSKEMQVSIQWKMIVGLSNPSVYETSMILHHIYGFPYLPGQAIKGVVRNYIIEENFDFDESKALKDKDFCDIFGTDNKSFYKESRKGNIIFFDGYPITSPKINIDVMNVHYSDYYNGNLAPTDYQNPIPIYFLIVKDTSFNILIGSKEKEIDEYKIKNTPITEWIKIALQENGIGAKTSIGYGRFELQD
ncbi:hypothetical protein XO12_07810 [Marinitoga sp. 1154]|nr:hypothetical protein [Marinitoga sp. 1154]